MSLKSSQIDDREKKRGEDEKRVGTGKQGKGGPAISEGVQITARERSPALFRGLTRPRVLMECVE